MITAAEAYQEALRNFSRLNHEREHTQTPIQLAYVEGMIKSAVERGDPEVRFTVDWKFTERAETMLNDLGYRIGCHLAEETGSYQYVVSWYIENISQQIAAYAKAGR